MKMTKHKTTRHLSVLSERASNRSNLNPGDLITSEGVSLKYQYQRICKDLHLDNWSDELLKIKSQYLKRPDKKYVKALFCSLLFLETLIC